MNVITCTCITIPTFWHMNPPGGGGTHMLDATDVPCRPEGHLKCNTWSTLLFCLNRTSRRVHFLCPFSKGLKLCTCRAAPRMEGVSFSMKCEWKGVWGSSLTHPYFSGPSAPPPGWILKGRNHIYISYEFSHQSSLHLIFENLNIWKVKKYSAFLRPLPWVEIDILTSSDKPLLSDPHGSP